jgi:cation/acetate symporter
VSAAWLALASPGIAARWAALAPSLVASGLFPPLILGLLWRRCTGLGALAGMLSGAFLAFFYFAVTVVEGDRLWSWFGLAGTAIPPFAGAAFGLPVAVVVTVIVSLVTPPEPERARVLDRIRTPAGLPRAAEDD